jgi:glyceraldehyde-3-phosphate dehydrogenase (NADP+)
MTDFDGLFLTPGARAVPKVEMTSFLINGEERPWTGPMTRVLSPILLKPAETFTDIGCFPSLTAKESVECAQAASKAFDLGRGEWPSMSPRQRINVLQTFLKGVRAATKEIAELIMWEVIFFIII